MSNRAERRAAAKVRKRQPDDSIVDGLFGRPKNLTKAEIVIRAKNGTVGELDERRARE